LKVKGLHEAQRQTFRVTRDHEHQSITANKRHRSTHNQLKGYSTSSTFHSSTTQVKNQQGFLAAREQQWYEGNDAADWPVIVVSESCQQWQDIKIEGNRKTKHSWN